MPIFYVIKLKYKHVHLVILTHERNHHVGFFFLHMYLTQDQIGCEVKKKLKIKKKRKKEVAGGSAF